MTKTTTTTRTHIFLCHRDSGDALLSVDKGICGGKIAWGGVGGTSVGIKKKKEDSRVTKRNPAQFTLLLSYIYVKDLSFCQSKQISVEYFN